MSAPVPRPAISLLRALIADMSNACMRSSVGPACAASLPSSMLLQATPSSAVTCCRMHGSLQQHASFVWLQPALSCQVLHILSNVIHQKCCLHQRHASGRSFECDDAMMMVYTCTCVYICVRSTAPPWCPRAAPVSTSLQCLCSLGTPDTWERSWCVLQRACM